MYQAGTAMAPIELKVIQGMKPAERQQLTPLELRHKARDFALGGWNSAKALNAMVFGVTGSILI